VSDAINQAGLDAVNRAQDGHERTLERFERCVEARDFWEKKAIAEQLENTRLRAAHEEYVRTVKETDGATWANLRQLVKDTAADNQRLRAVAEAARRFMALETTPPTQQVWPGFAEEYADAHEALRLAVDALAPPAREEQP
jgi:hypothetical protein